MCGSMVALFSEVTVQTLNPLASDSQGCLHTCPTPGVPARLCDPLACVCFCPIHPSALYHSCQSVEGTIVRAVALPLPLDVVKRFVSLHDLCATGQ